MDGNGQRTLYGNFSGFAKQKSRILIGERCHAIKWDRAALKIVEIGDVPFIKSAFPEQTYFFSTHAFGPVTDREAKIFNISLLTIKYLRELLSDPTVSLIVCHPTPFFAMGSKGGLARAFSQGKSSAGGFRCCVHSGRNFCEAVIQRPSWCSTMMIIR